MPVIFVYRKSNKRDAYFVFAAPQQDFFASAGHSFAFAQSAFCSVFSVFFGSFSLVAAETVEAVKLIVKTTAKINANFFMFYLFYWLMINSGAIYALSIDLQQSLTII